MLAIMLIHLYSLGVAFDRIDEFFFFVFCFHFCKIFTAQFRIVKLEIVEVVKKTNVNLRFERKCSDKYGFRLSYRSISQPTISSTF